jgi:hypothetical protein
MHWPTVVKNLREESNKDRSRAADLNRIGNATEAALITVASLVCSRLALAFEAGHKKAGEKKLPDEEKLDKSRKEGSGKNPPSKRKAPSKASRDFMGTGWGKHQKEKTVEAT